MIAVSRRQGKPQRVQAAFFAAGISNYAPTLYHCIFPTPLCHNETPADHTCPVRPARPVFVDAGRCATVVHARLWRAHALARNVYRCVLPTPPAVDGGAGSLHGGADVAAVPALRVDAGAAEIYRQNADFATIDAAVHHAHAGGGHGRSGFVRRTRAAVARLAGHTRASAVRQSVFQPARGGAFGLPRIPHRARPPHGRSTNIGRERMAAILACGTARVAALAGGCRLPDFPLLLFRLRAGAAAGRAAIRNRRSGNLPAHCL